MIQTIEIDVPYGKQAVWENGHVVFKEIPLPKTWDDFCRDYPSDGNEWFINYDSRLKPVGGGRRSESFDRFRFSSEEAAKAHLALIQLHLLRDCYRRGWVPDWTSDDDKVVIYTECNRLALCHTKEASRFLAFQDGETAATFLENFRDLIEQAGDLI